MRETFRFAAFEDTYSVRLNPDLIKMIEDGKYEDDEYAKLIVVEIPDEATDFTIIEYDGLESIFYVVDGKIHRIN